MGRADSRLWVGSSSGCCGAGGMWQIGNSERYAERGWPPLPEGVIERGCGCVRVVAERTDKAFPGRSARSAPARQAGRSRPRRWRPWASVGRWRGGRWIGWTSASDRSFGQVGRWRSLSSRNLMRVSPCAMNATLSCRTELHSCPPGDHPGHAQLRRLDGSFPAAHRLKPDPHQHLRLKFLSFNMLFDPPLTWAATPRIQSAPPDRHGLRVINRCGILRDNVRKAA